MKTAKYFLIAFLLLCGAATKDAQAKEPAAMHVSFGYFYDRLWSYGDWIELDGGLTVWRPTHISRGWAPYVRGNWIWTNCGWYWDSYDVFGDVVYHYGRWHYDDYYGWIWVPDYEWAPAWVEWRYDDDYIGWAPLPPYAAFNHSHGLVFSINFSINFNFFHFVRYRHFCEPNLSSYYIPDHDRYSVYNRTRVRNTYRYDNDRVVNPGVEREFIERRGNVRIREREVSFRENDNIRDRSVSVTRDRIDVSIPRERANETRAMNITRGNRTTNLNLDKITIGERSRTGGDRTRETVKTTEPRTSEPRQSVNRNDGSRVTTTPPERKPESETRTRVNTESRTPQVTPRERSNESVRTTTPERKAETPRVTAPERKQESVRVAPRETRTETPRAERSAPTRTERSRENKSDKEREARTR